MGWCEEVKGDWVKNWEFSESPKEWTNRLLGMEWLEKINTILSQQALFFLGGHDSHIIIEFAELCTFHNTILYCLPPHSTYLLTTS